MKVKVNTIAMLAIMAASFTTTTSCSNEDVPVSSQTVASAKSLEGEWINTTVHGEQYITLYHFFNDGIGWKEINVMKNDELVYQPISRYDTESEFNYSVAADGKVSVTYKETKETEELTLNGLSLMAKQNGADLSLVKATDVEMKKYQTESDLWHGGEDDNSNNVCLVYTCMPFTATDGMKLEGPLKHAIKISIADGATITLSYADVAGKSSTGIRNAGLTCLGDATIILEGENTVTSFDLMYPGIYVPKGKKLTIKGSGSLTAKSIGFETIPPMAGGIGAGNGKSCGSIFIEGGTVTAYGGLNAAAIGSAADAPCDEIVIANTVTSVTAIKHEKALCNIGVGNEFSTCAKVTIGGTDYWEDIEFKNDGNVKLTQDTFVYKP